MTQSFNNSGKLTIKDNSVVHKGKIENLKTTLVNNYATLVIDNYVSMKTVGTGIYATSGSRSTIKNSEITANGTMFSIGDGHSNIVITVMPEKYITEQQTVM